MSYELGNIMRVVDPRQLGGLGCRDCQLGAVDYSGGIPQCAKYRGNPRAGLMCQMSMKKCGKPSCQTFLQSVAPFAAVVAAPFLIAAAPAIAKGAMVGVKSVGRGVAKILPAAKKAARGSLIGPPAPSGFIGPPAPTEFVTAPSESGGGATSPGFSPLPSIPSEPSVSSDTTPAQAAGVGAPAAGILPVVIIGGVLLLGMFAKPPRTSRR